MPCDWSPCGLDEEMQRANGEGSSEFSGAKEFYLTPEVAKADGIPHGPSCLMLSAMRRHQGPYFADLEVGVAEQDFEVTCSCIHHTLCQAWNLVTTELSPGLYSLEGCTAF